MDETKVKTAIREVLLDQKSYSTSLNYAVEYCREALNMSGEELRIRCLYILSNLKSWRAPKAKEIREILTTFVKVERKKPKVYGRRVR